MLPAWLQIVLAVASPIFAAGGAYAAVRVKLEWHWSEIQRAHTRVERLENLEFQRAE